jgi:formate/nitrite transporter FocA (FNT family)
MSSTAQHKKELEKIDEEIVERTSPPGRVVYEAIYREGQHELERSNQALAWSGLAAGLSMGFSFLAEGLLRDYLPNAPWRPAVAKLGYSIGFLIVILGRQQLFTKNTLTVILPLLREKKLRILVNVARLWLVVLGANVIGALAVTWVFFHSNVCTADVKAQFVGMAAESMQFNFATNLLRAIFAGWLIALIIWLLPFAESAHIWIIVFFAYLLGIGHLPHIIAGMMPSFFSVLNGNQSFGEWLTGFFVPVLIGNAIGGVAVVALVVHAEFIDESGKQVKTK